MGKEKPPTVFYTKGKTQEEIAAEVLEALIDGVEYYLNKDGMTIGSKAAIEKLKQDAHLRELVRRQLPFKDRD